MKRAAVTLCGAAAVGACVVGLLAMEPVAAGPGPGGAQRSSEGQRSSEEQPNRPSAEQARRPSDPLTEARRAVRRTPEDPAAWAQLASVEIERARTTLDTARLDQAEKALHRSRRLDPGDNYQAELGLGRLANARHEFTDGRKWGLRTVRMAPDRAEGYGVLADAEIQLGHYGAARTAVQRMLDREPDTAAYSRAAYDLETHGRVRDAQIALRRAAQAAGTPDETAFAEERAGELAWSQGRLTQAERHFRQALDAVPRHPYAQSGLARVHAARGRTGTALRLYDRLTRRTPLPQFLLEAAELKRAARGPDAASGELAALKAQLQVQRARGGPVDPHLALYAADHGEPKAAVRLLREEWRTTRSVIVADALGWALHRAGRDTEALPYVRTAARTGWKNALFHYHRGVVERELGRTNEGDRRLRQALRLNPHFSQSHAPEAKRLLRDDDATNESE